MPRGMGEVPRCWSGSDGLTQMKHESQKEPRLGIVGLVDPGENSGFILSGVGAIGGFWL